MKEQLTIQELSAYLPYNLKAEMLDYKNDYIGKQYDEIIGVHQWDKLCLYWSALTVGGSKPNIERIKPLLLPLSHLTKEIEHKGETFVPMLKLVDPDNTEWDKMRVESYNPFPQVGLQHDYYRVIHEKLGEIITINPKNISVLPYHLVQKLHKWHFDTFGLIDRGLAVNKLEL